MSTLTVNLLKRTT